MASKLEGGGGALKKELFAASLDKAYFFALKNYFDHVSSFFLSSPCYVYEMEAEKMLRTYDVK